jgi:ABC-type transport system substrate-binding protein
VAAVSVAVALLIAAGCTTASPDSGAGGPVGTGSVAAPAPRTGGKVVVAMSSDPDGLNPTANEWAGPAYQVARAILDPLVVMDRNNHWQPYLAQSITPNADFTAWTFTLRPGVTFHDGEALDADALVAFFRADLASPIVTQGFADKPAIDKTGPMTVKLSFAKPWSEMPTVFADQAGYVIAPAQIASGDAHHPIGTGPFVFDEWVPGNHLTAHRNPHYWRAGLPYLDSITFRPVSEATARENALQAGDADVAELGNEGQSKISDLRSAGFHIIDDFDNAGTDIALMNTGRGPLQDKDVRRAVVEAIDRDAYRDTILDGSHQIADQPYPPGSKWHVDVAYPGYDLNRAKSFFADYQAQHGKVSLTMLSVSAGPATAAELIQQQLDAAGIEVKIESLDVSRFTKQFVTGDFDLVFVGGFLFAADPDASYPFITGANADPASPIKLNFTEYRNAAVDQALQAQRQTDSDAVRAKQWATIWTAFATDVPYAFLAYTRYAFATTSDVYGLTDFTTPEGASLPAINHWTPFYTAVYRAGS